MNNEDALQYWNEKSLRWVFFVFLFFFFLLFFFVFFCKEKHVRNSFLWLVDTVILLPILRHEKRQIWTFLCWQWLDIWWHWNLQFVAEHGSRDAFRVSISCQCYLQLMKGGICRFQQKGLLAWRYFICWWKSKFPIYIPWCSIPRSIVASLRFQELPVTVTFTGHKVSQNDLSDQSAMLWAQRSNARKYMTSVLPRNNRHRSAARRKRLQSLVRDQTQTLWPNKQNKTKPLEKRWDCRMNVDLCLVHLFASLKTCRDLCHESWH